MFARREKVNLEIFMILSRYKILEQKDLMLKDLSDKNLWRKRQFYKTYRNDKKFFTLWRQSSQNNNKIIFYVVREKRNETYSLAFERTFFTNEQLSLAIIELPQNIKDLPKDIYTWKLLEFSKNHKVVTLERLC